MPTFLSHGQHRDKTVLTYCTGGIRCEKFSAMLLEEGFENVCQLDGGVCVECLVDADCTRLMDPQRRACNPANGRCYQSCTTDSHCAAPSTCKMGKCK